MKILVVHNRYRPDAPSGENAVVDQEAAALTSRGHDVVVFQRHSEEISAWSPLKRATIPVRLLWSEESRPRLPECAGSELATHRRYGACHCRQIRSMLRNQSAQRISSCS
jgi:hypothetical protein